MTITLQYEIEQKVTNGLGYNLIPHEEESIHGLERHLVQMLIRQFERQRLYAEGNKDKITELIVNAGLLRTGLEIDRAFQRTFLNLNYILDDMSK